MYKNIKVENIMSLWEGTRRKLGYYYCLCFLWLSICYYKERDGRKIKKNNDVDINNNDDGFIYFDI